MRKLALLSFVFLCAFTTKSDVNTDPNDSKNLPGLLPNNIAPAGAQRWVDSLYNNIHLAGAGLSKQAFFNAYKGYQYLLSQGKLSNSDFLTICDYSQASSEKRLYVIDLKNNIILYHTYVAHGHNSGAEMANSFSNLNSSNKSSLGFLVTAETYTGHNGYSMRFDGMESGINDNVRSRDVVMHGSAYVCAGRAMMGRSWGCPAVANTESTEIINTIKGGSCFYIYNPDIAYARQSKILNARFDWPALTTLPSLANLSMPKGMEESITMQ